MLNCMDGLAGCLQSLWYCEHRRSQSYSWVGSWKCQVLCGAIKQICYYWQAGSQCRTQNTEIRKSMKTKLGHTSIVVNTEVHISAIDDEEFSQMIELWSQQNGLFRHMYEVGYVLHIKFVVDDVEDEEPQCHWSGQESNPNEECQLDSSHWGWSFFLQGWLLMQTI